MIQDKSVIFEKVCEFIKKTVDDYPTTIELNTPLEEIAFNSIDFIKLLVFLEDEFEIEFEDDDLVLENYRTMEDLITTIEKTIEE